MIDRKKNIIGSMRDEVQLMKPLIGRDDSGSEIVTWVTSQKLWANIDYKEAGSSENNVAARIHSFVRANITLRYIERVDAKMKIFSNSYEWDIETVLYSHRRDFMVLECTQLDKVQLQSWSTEDGQNWITPGGDSWLLKTSPSSIQDETGITWTNDDGSIWTVTG